MFVETVQFFFFNQNILSQFHWDSTKQISSSVLVFADYQSITASCFHTIIHNPNLPFSPLKNHICSLGYDFSFFILLLINGPFVLADYFDSPLIFLPILPIVSWCILHFQRKCKMHSI